MVVMLGECINVGAFHPVDSNNKSKPSNIRIFSKSRLSGSTFIAIWQ
jgi:hypothetical protein